jgi:hypothetical protein
VGGFLDLQTFRPDLDRFSNQANQLRMEREVSKLDGYMGR